ncbi:Transposon Tf2-6 polyprotein [Labeo rohita]|uniref:Transposon Tf2-6 polyprotein n=1 Tax=Labeo rohita TaxID=84645 RepID=A0ABQ8L6W7_LABRO|nr:Transposon Tf2-6 polyprotein [Labeo rohita]
MAPGKELPGAQPPGKDCLVPNYLKDKISSVHPRAPGDGGVYSRSAKARIHPTIPLSGRFEHLLRGQEGWRFTSLHRLRQLNSQIIQQPYPLPLVPAALEEHCGARVFTKLDLRSAYNLVRLRAGNKWKTAFITPTGHYGYRAKHHQHVQQVLQKLCEHSLYLKLEKCEFHQPSVQFLGYNISAEGVQMDQGKVNAIQEWPQPSSVKELQCFLGFSNFYRRFIKGYSSITAPLTSLLRVKPKHLTWNPAANGAFQWLKTIFSTTPLLHHPDPERPFTVEVDASTLSPGEQNYDVGNRELLAIKLALEEW